MKTSYTASLKMPDGRIWQEVNCDIDLDLEWENGEPFIVANDVLVDVSKSGEPSQYVSLFSDTATPLMKLIGAEICDLADADDDLLTEALEHEGGYITPSPAYVSYASGEAM
ncbi:hypothetical protein GCM10011491_30420 [Brucella endophytica]|uniref:Uncharacterized protein n=1 Tax=Brucella endophytica TaxID=1963359 RepID=A0A916WGW8_9HYPH|nr:hypothetical protein [Brucella endophytica]GGB00081.1 hypothetical protein GCM10011491_30420 [Brucella endophytica]